MKTLDVLGSEYPKSGVAVPSLIQVAMIDGEKTQKIKIFYARIVLEKISRIKFFGFAVRSKQTRKPIRGTF